MSEAKPENLNSQAVPFFARFLEGQNFEDLSDQESEAVSGGCTVQTKKYPSDNEEFVTLKYPSDGEDGGGGFYETLKYPSDGEEA
ncbi:microviridin/marinostatin family tricyclic proteinase inhibitor [Nostoc sp. CENA67]|uniref:Microviridin/marinostatin family tricyclic proteinase inhibitor n=1 Tax=Amazonocrinis nigriterrae CENA67 TaxID=2794033 RepID=A0A8J7I221_9NOST|nr:microviridin/marinostatin family tricyclic proteinase inhibitor [Amazonocrinis nigriterrae]MBH8566664.1 microviridin/marinostatin family tricyclic proteinase inhibitor [Amazonocrinis nigriterrae CENA67]